MPRPIALYARFNSKTRDAPGQVPDLQRWAGDRATPVRWYQDHFTGSDPVRPSFAALLRDIEARAVGQVVVWRLDRLGRTAKGLTAFFAILGRRRVNLISLEEGLDLSTPEGRLWASMLASVARYETECCAEGILAGQAAARARGMRWGGSPIDVTVSADWYRPAELSGPGYPEVAAPTVTVAPDGTSITFGPP